jgi:hypothetical protein
MKNYPATHGGGGVHAGFYKSKKILLTIVLKRMKNCPAMFHSNRCFIPVALGNHGLLGDEDLLCRDLDTHVSSAIIRTSFSQIMDLKASFEPGPEFINFKGAQESIPRNKKIPPAPAYGPGIDSEESFPPAYIAWRAGTRYDNSIPTRFLTPTDCSKIPALDLVSFCFRTNRLPIIRTD